MTLGRADRQGDLSDDAAKFCERSLPKNSIYRFLARERERLFPDELFADLFRDRGRRSVPPSVVATVMVLQRLEGLSDREAVDRFAFDARWRYAGGVSGYGRGGWDEFAHTVLVDMRARLRGSPRPDRIFEVGLAAAREAGLVGHRRVLDSTPLYDAVATMDTVTLIRSAVRGLLAVADAQLAAGLRAALSGADDYATAAKPQIDWDDAGVREELIDSRARDGYALLALLDGRELAAPVRQAAALLATVLGQDLDEGEDGVFRVAPDGVLPTVEPDARHGHQTSPRGFDGYKGHAAVDPDSEVITSATVTSRNASDASAAADRIADLVDDLPGPAGSQLAGPRPKHETAQPETAQHARARHARAQHATDRPARAQHATDRPARAQPATARPARAQHATDRPATAQPSTAQPSAGWDDEPATVYGDNAHGAGEFHDRLRDDRMESLRKTRRLGGWHRQKKQEVDKSYLLPMILVAGLLAMALAIAEIFSAVHFGGAASCPPAYQGSKLGTCSPTETVNANY